MNEPPVLRKIIHIDMDAFYASVEIRDNPSLRGKPVIVGGLPGTRGVVCTASYEARKYGVHSAMSANRAAVLCPDGIFLPPRFAAYKEASARMHEVFHEYTDLVEPLSLDEAYLDVTQNKPDLPYASRIAREIREKIHARTGGLTASAGVSFNKFLAKMASDIHKPNGMTVIPPGRAIEFLSTLPIEKFYGVGKVTAEQMHRLGVRNGADLRKKTKLELAMAFGSAGEFYYNIARGVDPREVCADRERKSLGVEETFEHDVDSLRFLSDVLALQADDVSGQLRQKGLPGRTVTLKVKFFDFRTITRSQSFQTYFNDAQTIRQTAFQLLKKTEAGKIRVRLIGITVSGFPVEKKSGAMEQLEFDFESGEY